MAATESERGFRIVVDEISAGSTFSARSLFENIAPLVADHVVDSVGVMPRRYDTAHEYIRLSKEYGVPIETVWGMLSGDTRDVISQVRHSVRPMDAVGVLMIAAGNGTQDGLLSAKRYGDTRKFVFDVRNQQRLISDERIKFVMAHESQIAQLKKTGKLQRWIKSLAWQNVFLVRTNGWSPSLGRPQELSWNYETMKKDADEYGYLLATVPDVFYRTREDLFAYGLNPSLVHQVEVTQPKLFYLSDSNSAGEEKLVIGDGDHEAEIIDALAAFVDQGGNTVVIKVRRDPKNLLRNIYRTRGWADEHWPRK